MVGEVGDGEERMSGQSAVRHNKDYRTLAFDNPHNPTQNKGLTTVAPVARPVDAVIRTVPAVVSHELSHHERGGVSRITRERA